MPFQQHVNTVQAPAVAGDFASGNPRFTLPAGPGGMVAGAGGVVVGSFVFRGPMGNDVVQAAGAAPGIGSQIAGFVAREQQGLITTYLAESGQLIPAGFAVTVYTGGDFWVGNQGNEATIGQKAYADNNTGLVSFFAPGTPDNMGTSTASTIAPASGTSTGSINGKILTVTQQKTGKTYIGATPTGSSVQFNLLITAQLTQAAGAAGPNMEGTYELNADGGTTPSTTLTTTYGLLTLGGTIVNPTNYDVGDVLVGNPALAPNTTITQVITSGATFVVNPQQTVASGVINAQKAIETKWYAMSNGAKGELIKISDHPTG